MFDPHDLSHKMRDWICSSNILAVFMHSFSLLHQLRRFSIQNARHISFRVWNVFWIYCNIIIIIIIRRRHLYCATKCRPNSAAHIFWAILYPEQNTHIFSILLNPDSDNESSWRFLGRELQAEGVEKQKLRFPNRLCRVRGMRSIEEMEERREACDGSAGTRIILKERYLGAEEWIT